jgi:MT-A70
MEKTSMQAEPQINQKEGAMIPTLHESLTLVGRAGEAFAQGSPGAAVDDDNDKPQQRGRLRNRKPTERWSSRQGPQRESSEKFGVILADPPWDYSDKGVSAVHDLPSVVSARRGKQSVKPVEAYEYIEAMYPALSKLELFARCARPEWLSWGDEAESGPATPKAYHEIRYGAAV